MKSNREIVEDVLARSKTLARHMAEEQAGYTASFLTGVLHPAPQMPVPCRREAARPEPTDCVNLLLRCRPHRIRTQAETASKVAAAPQ